MSNRTALLALLIAVVGCATSDAADDRAPPSAYPNRTLTPGETFAGVTAAEVCVPGYARRVRFVPVAEMRAVDREYHVRYVRGESAIDHLIPLELGGDNGIRNLWPQPYGGAWSAGRKDELENELHDRVCSGALALEEAQRIIVRDWIAAYRRYVGR